MVKILVLQQLYNLTDDARNINYSTVVAFCNFWT
jgi:hypothetical protein